MSDESRAREAQADARKATADARAGEAEAREVVHTKADRAVIRNLLYLAILMFLAVLVFAYFAGQSYVRSRDASDEAVACIALVQDHQADAWLGVAAAFTTPAVATDPTYSRLRAVNQIVLAADAMKVQAAKCAGTKVPPLPTTLPIPPVTTTP